MLTEAQIFPNIGFSKPADIAKLCLQDRVRLRVTASYLTAEDLVKMRTREGAIPRDEPDEVQCVCFAQQP